MNYEITVRLMVGADSVKAARDEVIHRLLPRISNWRHYGTPLIPLLSYTIEPSSLQEYDHETLARTGDSADAQGDEFDAQ